MMSPAADRLPSNVLPERELKLGWLDALVAYRRTVYTLLVLLYIASFNGIWRIGVDTALYRGLARSIARGDGYVFAGEKHHHAFAGMPLLLAGLEKVFGDSILPGILLVMLMALATLWFVDRLIAMRYPLWVATIITLGLGLNYRFFEHAQDVMTDVPFALGVVASLYGLERLRTLDWSPRGPILRAVLIFVCGMGLAAATRPTFGVLALAIVLGSFFRGIRNLDGKRWLHFGIVGMSVIVLLGLILSDPRTAGLRPFSGVYEQELVERVQDLPRTYLGQLDRFLSQNLNESFFAQHMTPIGIPTALVLLVGGWLVLRRNIVWGLVVFGIVLVTLPLSTVPRYYIMAMPMLWLGWILIASWIGLKAPASWRGPIVFILLIFPLGMNLGRICGFVYDQRRPDYHWLVHGKDRETTFYETYRRGIIPQQLMNAQMIAEHAKPGQIVVGPASNVLAYFSDRRVLGVRNLFGAKDVPISRLPTALAKAKPEMAIFPANQYEGNDTQLRDLIRKRILLPDQLLATSGDATLNTCVVRVPEGGGNWKTAPQPTRSATATATRGLSPTEKAELLAKRERKQRAIERQERIERELRKERKLERERREAAALRKAKLEKQRKLEQKLKKERQLKKEQQLKKQRKEERERRERKERNRLRAEARAAATQPTTMPTSAPTAQP